MNPDDERPRGLSPADPVWAQLEAAEHQALFEFLLGTLPAATVGLVSWLSVRKQRKQRRAQLAAVHLAAAETSVDAQAELAQAEAPTEELPEAEAEFAAALVRVESALPSWAYVAVLEGCHMVFETGTGRLVFGPLEVLTMAGWNDEDLARWCRRLEVRRPPVPDVTGADLAPPDDAA